MDENNRHFWPWRHWHFWPFAAFNNEFTQPLLFDDSLTLLQKIAMLWKKLYDLIQDYNQFKADFYTWKAQVEKALKDLADAIEALDARVSTLEECCADMQAWKTTVDAWRADIDAWKTTVDAWRAAIDAWKTGVDETLAGIGQSITTINQTIVNQGDNITEITENYTTLQETVTNLGDQITNLGDDLTALTQRVTNTENDIDNIQDALARLDIQLPVSLIDDTNYNGAADSWYDWIANYCDTHAGNTTGTFKAAWTLTDDIQPGIVAPHPTPAKSLVIGKLGENIALCKMPLMVYTTLQTPTTKANEAACIAEVLQIISDTGMDKLLTDGLNAVGTDSFFSFNMLESYPHRIDECKFQTSYMLFCYHSGPAYTDISKLYALTIDTAGNKLVTYANNINMDVRIRLEENSNVGQMQVLSNAIYFNIYNGIACVCFLAENS